MISSTGSFVTSVVGSPSPTFSPVNGLIVVGVVVVFSPVCPSCVTFSSPGFKSGLNSRFFSNGISSLVTSGSPAFGPCFVTSSTGGVTTLPVSGFLMPGLPGTSSVPSIGKFGSNSSLWPCGTSSGAKCTISSTGFFVTSVVGSPRSTTSPVSGSTLVGVVVVFSPSSPFCTITSGEPGSRVGSNSRIVLWGIGCFVTSTSSIKSAWGVVIVTPSRFVLIIPSEYLFCIWLEVIKKLYFCDLSIPKSSVVAFHVFPAYVAVIVLVAAS